MLLPPGINLNSIAEDLGRERYVHLAVRARAPGPGTTKRAACVCILDFARLGLGYASRRARRSLVALGRDKKSQAKGGGAWRGVAIVKRIFATALAAACVAAATPGSAWHRHCRVASQFEQGNPDRI